jgi:hypothetical protein
MHKLRLPTRSRTSIPLSCACEKFWKAYDKKLRVVKDGPADHLSE